MAPLSRSIRPDTLAVPTATKVIQVGGEKSLGSRWFRCGKCHYEQCEDVGTCPGCGKGSLNEVYGIRFGGIHVEYDVIGNAFFVCNPHEHSDRLKIDTADALEAVCYMVQAYQDDTGRIKTVPGTGVLNDATKPKVWVAATENSAASKRPNTKWWLAGLAAGIIAGACAGVFGAYAYFEQPVRPKECKYVFMPSKDWEVESYLRDGWYLRDIKVVHDGGESIRWMAIAILERW